MVNQEQFDAMQICVNDLSKSLIARLEKAEEEIRRLSVASIKRAMNDALSNKPTKSPSETREELRLKPIIVDGTFNASNLKIKNNNVTDHVEGPVTLVYRDASDGTMKCVNAEFAFWARK